MNYWNLRASGIWKKKKKGFLSKQMITALKKMTKALKNR